MPWFRSHRDEIDAVLGDDLVDDDLADVAAIVHDLRAAYLRDEALPRHAALLAFTATPVADGEPKAPGAHQTTRAPDLDPPTRTRSRVAQTTTALLATLAGKVVLGTAVAAASVGGLHAAEVVDVPGLPDRAAEQSVDHTEEPQSQGARADEARPPTAVEHPGGPGAATTDAQETTTAAQSKQEAAEEAFTADMKTWAECADDPDQPEEAQQNEIELCGEPPQPGDYGLTEPPTDQADERGASERTPAPDAPGGEAENDPSDRGSDTRADPPASGDADGGDANGPDDDPSGGQGAAGPSPSPRPGL